MNSNDSSEGVFSASAMTACFGGRSLRGTRGRVSLLGRLKTAEVD
jgi:hypothetical protein